MISLETLKELEIAVKHAEKYKPEGNLQQVKGFTGYAGGSTADKIYPSLFNILISLNLQLIEKINKLTVLLEKQKEPIHTTTTLSDDIEKQLIDQISRLHIGTEPSVSKKPTTSYTY